MNAASRLSDRAKAALAAALVVVLIVLLVAAAEVAVRVRQAMKYGYAGSLDQMYQLDERTGLRVPRAGSTFGPIEINGLGFRGSELTMPKPAGTVRLAFLGASTTFSAEASSNQAVWPHLVTEAFRRQFPGKVFDYVNGGVPGYTVASSLRNLELRVAPLAPDLIVIYHGTNDLSGELRRIAAASGVARNISPPEASWLSRHSLLWNLVSKNLRLLVAQQGSGSHSMPAISFDPETLGAGFREDLTRLVRAAKATGVPVAIATFSVHMREGQSDEQRRRAMQSAALYMPGFDAYGLIKAYGRYNQLIGEVARSEGAILVGDENRIPGDPMHFVDSVHFTDAGNRAQAERVSSVLLGNPSVVSVIERSN